MFGNFDQTFGIPTFPMEGMDPQGGLFGANTPAGAPGAGAQGPALNLPGAGQPAAPPAAGGGLGAPAPAQPALGAPSALGGGVLSPGAGAAPPAANDAQAPTAPAAGVGSPLGKVGV